MNLRGTLSLLILQTLALAPSHGYRVAQEIKRRSEGVLDFREGSLYPALHGLENRGWVESTEQLENGRARRYYRLTERGAEALVAERRRWDELSRAVTLVLEGA